MVESLQNGHVDGFCVGAPWNSVAVDLGVGHILHLGSEVLARAAEKVLAMRERWAGDHPELVARLVRAHQRAADFVEDERNRQETAQLLAAPNRVGVAAEVIRHTLDGRLKVSSEGGVRTDPNYLLIGRAQAARPDPAQAAWLYAQMVRWGQAPFSREMLAAAKAVFRPDLYDAAIGKAAARPGGEPADGIGAFAGPPFDPENIQAHLAAWTIKRPPSA
jgi:NitT/TauT family transport system ATP-binding protein